MNRNKRLLKRICAAGLGTMVMINTAGTAYAAEISAEKDENVYATLGNDGSVSGVYVVNEFSSGEAGEFSDYGNYTSLQNLTDESELVVESGHITGTMPKGKFYYQGNLESEDLPWNISIQYFLDGEELDGEELAGKSGNLKIRITTSQNPAVDETFFENYLLQATVALNTDKCSDIQAEGATAGNVGVNRQLLYTILPGEEKEIEITAVVQDFEMDAMTFQGVPLSLGISENMLDDIDFGSQTEELTDAVGQLDDGVGELLEGMEAAADGGSQLAKGITALASGTGQLQAGSQSLPQGTAALLGGVKELQSGVNQYTDGVDSFAQGVEQYVRGVELISGGINQLEPLKDLSLVDDAIVQLYQAVAVGQQQQGIPSLQAGAEGIAAGLHAIINEIESMQNGADAEKLQELLGSMQQIQELLGSLSDKTGEVGTAIGQCAIMINAVSDSHQKVLEGINSQIETANQAVSESAAQLAKKVNNQISERNEDIAQANQTLSGVNEQISSANGQIDDVNAEISQAVSDVNGQIDQAIAAIASARDNGTLDTAAAQQAIDALQASKASGQTVNHLEDVQLDTIDSIDAVQAPDVQADPIQMPEEDAQIVQTAAALQTIAEQLQEASGMFLMVSTQLQSKMEELGADLPALDSAESLAQLTQALTIVCEAADAVSAGIGGVGDALEQLSQNTASFGEAGEGIAALQAGTQELNQFNSQLTGGSREIIAAGSVLKGAVTALVSGVSQLDDGAAELVNGINTLYEGTSLLDSNTGTLVDGLRQLAEGTGTLKEGTEEFRKQTDNIDEKVKEEIEKMIDEVSGTEFEPVSFTSEKNTNIGLVQFALTTEGIRIPEVEEEEEPEEDEEGFFDRLKQLFQ